jgi:hypothetical protein
MSFKDRIKKQTLVFWNRTGIDSQGQPTFTTPAEKTCRWVDKNEKFINAGGEELISRSIVIVDGVSVGDVILLGTIALNVTDSNLPFENEGAYEVKRVDTTPNLRNSVTWYRVYL